MLRRSRGAAGRRRAPRLTFADIELDDETPRGVEGRRAGRRCRRPSSSCCATSCRTPAGCCRKAQILDHVWHYDFGGDANVVESYVSYLRRKVDTTEPRLLHTLRGVGYVLRQSTS